MTRLQPYSLSACKLYVTSSNQETQLSGVWVRGAIRDVVLTVSHFKKDTKIPTNNKNTTAKVFTVLDGNVLNAQHTKCELFFDFNDPCGEKDFAVFTPCIDEDARSPAQAITLATISTKAWPFFSPAISFGYNTAPTKGEDGHPNGRVQDCPCSSCWYASGNAVCEKLARDKASVPSYEDALRPGFRTISVGEWKQGQGPEKICHTATGWYGIFGAGMYTKESDGKLHLVGLCKCRHTKSVAFLFS